MNRQNVTGNRDTKMFERTARHTKKINIKPMNMRGGIRL